VKLKFVFVALLLSFWHIPVAQGDLRIHFIAVGHGDAILIEVDGEATALVDAGKPEAGPLVLNYLRRLGYDRIEHLFVTHDHDDHVGGVPLILDSLDVGVVHHTGMVHDWETSKVFQDYLQSGRWKVDVTDVGDLPVDDGKLTIRVLSPAREETEGKVVQSNPFSMVLMITYGNTKILLPADIDAARESQLIEHYGDELKSDAMKACHHASVNGNSRPFLQTVQPRIVAVTVGPNPWGYPDENTLIRLNNHCPVVMRTDEVGTIVLQSDGKNVQVIKPEGIEP
jgi:competence protein ComEC